MSRPEQPPTAARLRPVDLPGSPRTSPHRPDEPRLGLDMANYDLVKPVQDRPGDPATDWHWEPKEALHALARAYGRGAAR